MVVVQLVEVCDAKQLSFVAPIRLLLCHVTSLQPDPTQLLASALSSTGVGGYQQLLDLLHGSSTGMA